MSESRHSEQIDSTRCGSPGDVGLAAQSRMSDHAVALMGERGPQTVPAGGSSTENFGRAAGAVPAGGASTEKFGRASVEQDGSLSFGPACSEGAASRVADAKYPRIGQAWNQADNMQGEDRLTTMARHGLVFAAPETFGLQWGKTAGGEQATNFTDASIDKARQTRSELLEKNPNAVMLAEIRYHDASPSLYSKDSPFWQHDPNSRQSDNRVRNPSYKEYDKLDFSNSQFQQHVVDQCKAAVKSGAVDGVMLDWWNDGSDTNSDKAAKLQLLQMVRDAIGPDALIMVNTNQYTMPEFMSQQLKGGDKATPLVNGYYMEGFNKPDKQHPGEQLPWTQKDFQQLASTLDYAQAHTREPRVNMAETWWEMGNSAGRQDLSKMRATTTLVMTHSDGYSLFADPDNNHQTKDHQHSWYPFYDTGVGKPLAPGSARADGAYGREFEHGTVISNATGDHPITVTFPQPRIRASEISEGKTPHASRTFTINPQDGDIFLRTQ